MNQTNAASEEEFEWHGVKVIPDPLIPPGQMYLMAEDVPYDDLVKARLLQIAQNLEANAVILRIIGGYDWSAYDLDYLAAKLRKEAGEEGAFSAFNERYAPKKAENPAQDGAS